MPTYVYEILGEDGAVIGSFETIHAMKDPPLTRDPASGRPVRRAVVAPHLAFKHTERKEKKSLSRENLESHGFTRYERDGSGGYVRTAGREGPADFRVS